MKSYSFFDILVTIVVLIKLLNALKEKITKALRWSCSIQSTLYTATLDAALTTRLKKISNLIFSVAESFVAVIESWVAFNFAAAASF